MSTTTTPRAASDTPQVHARHAGFARDLGSVALRALRQSREPEAVIPALIIPVFFFIVNVGALQEVAERGGCPTSAPSRSRWPSSSP